MCAQVLQLQRYFHTIYIQHTCVQLYTRRVISTANELSQMERIGVATKFEIKEVKKSRCREFLSPNL